MRKVSLIVSLLCLLFAACKRPTAFKEVQSQKGLFTIEVPEYMTVSNNIFPRISEIEYRNDSIPMYVVGFDTSRDGLDEKTLKAYYDAVEEHPSIDSAVLEQAKFLMVNGDSAYKSKLSGYVGGEKFVYLIETLATPDKFYSVLVWTKANKENELKEVMDKIL